MADTEPVWRRCDDCEVPYIIVAVMNPRKNIWAPLPLSYAPEGERGNFDVNWNASPMEVFDAQGRSIGAHPIATYGLGEYRPHPPGHFLDDVHAEHTKGVRQRLHNFVLAMDDDDDDDNGITPEQVRTGIRFILEQGIPDGS